MAFFDTILSVFKRTKEDLKKLPFDDNPPRSRPDIDSEEQNISLTDLVKFFEDDSNKKDDDFFKQLSSLFGGITIPIERLRYYKQLQDVYDVFPLAKRIVNVYVSSICRPDPITNKIITQKLNDRTTQFFDESLIRTVKNKQNLILAYFKIEENLRDKIAPKAVLFGNLYVEIIDKNRTLGINKVLEEQRQEEVNKQKLQHAIRYLEETKEYTLNGIQDALDYLIDAIVQVDFSDVKTKCIEEIAERDTDVTTVLLESEEKETPPSDILKSLVQNITLDKLSNIELKYYLPYYVLPIHNDTRIFGYLVIQENVENIAIKQDITKYLTQLFNPSRESDKKLEQIARDNYKKLSEFIISKIKSKFEKELSNIYEEDEKVKELLKILYQQSREVFYLIRELFVEKKLSSVKIRFVPTDNMVNFAVNPQNWPYGQSVIEPLVFYSKLYMLTLLSNVIMRVSRASIVRKWTVDAGIRQQHGNLVQKLKRELMNKAITIDSFGSLQAMPRMLTDYKDYITITKSGRPFVDFTIQQTGDPSVDIQDLDYLRQEMVTTSSVPSPYLGLVEAIDLREQLVTANIVWSETVSSIQQMFNDKINELVDKVFIAINRENIENNQTSVFLPSRIVTLSLNMPVVLQIQHLDAIFASLSNVLQILMSSPEGQAKIDIMKLLRKFVPTINWDEFSKDEVSKREDELKSITSTQQQPPTQGGGVPGMM
jgi:hypothetical protein